MCWIGSDRMTPSKAAREHACKSMRGQGVFTCAGLMRTSVSMMSAAPLAAEVAPATAMPTFAFFSAGASFTPSPARGVKEFGQVPEAQWTTEIILATMMASSQLRLGVIRY